MRRRSFKILVVVLLALTSLLFFGWFKWVTEYQYGSATLGGKTTNQVIERLGRPNYDSREIDRDTNLHFFMGYYNCIGGRYRIEFKDGVVVASEYQGSR